MTRRSALLVALLAALAACTENPTKLPDGGTPIIPPGCNNWDVADTTESCRLPLDTEVKGMLSVIDQNDWWLLNIDTLPPRALLTVTAKYKSTSTPVTVMVNVLKADHATSIAHASDPRASSHTTAGGPSPAQAVARVTETGKYYVIVRHDDSLDDPQVDKKNDYYLIASLGSDPDLNEPNDTTATATSVTLAACGSTTQAIGALSTAGDVDYFTFTASPCGGAARTILYFSLAAPASPELHLRVHYILTDSTGAVVAEDYARQFETDQLIATARLTAGGKYNLAVNAYQAKTDTTAPPGDLGFIYTLKVGLFSDKDVNEGTGGNDTIATATAASVAVGGTKTFNGRLSFIGDKDIYSFAAPAGGARLHYKVTYHSAAGQFPAIPNMMAQRQLSLYTTTATVQACLANCGGDDVHTSAWCQHSQCLHQQRMEDKDISDMGNFEGEAFVAAGSGTWYVEVSYNGADGADDLTYDLLLDVRSAADEHPQSSPSVVNAGSDATGVVGWGHGMLGPGADNQLGRVARGLLDYDADFAHEWFQFNFTPGAADQALTLSWTVSPGASMHAGQRSYDLGLHFIFCVDAGCTQKVDVPGKDVQQVFGYDGSPYNPWYYGQAAFADAGLPGMQKAFDPFNSSTGVFKLADVQCSCMDKAYAGSGKFFVVVEPINRTSYDDSPIKLSFSLHPYPPHVTDDSGRAFDCPVPCGWLGFYAANQ